MSNITQKENKDLFSQSLQYPLLNNVVLIFNKYKEYLLYLIFGVLSFLISVETFAFFINVFHVNVLVSNIIAWVFSVTFAYITNRTWVFPDKATGTIPVILEIGKFIAGRLITLFLEEFILFIFISRLCLNSLAVKITASIVVIILNYFFSKLWIFRR